MSISGIDDSVQRQQGLWQHGSKKQVSRLARKMMRELDTDNDHKLSLSESGLSEEAFKKLDADSDGSVSGRELKAGVRNNRDKIIAMMEEEQSQESTVSSENAAAAVASFMKSADGNADGKFSEDEIGVSGKAFDALDTNKDGSVSADELQAAIESGKVVTSQDGGLAFRLGKPDASYRIDPAIADTMKKLDADGNGTLSQTESKLDTKVFAKLDTNSDGELQTEEVSNGLIAARKQFEAIQDMLHPNGRTSAQAMKRAIDAYTGHMGDLMTKIFGDSATASTPTGTDSTADATGGVTGATGSTTGTTTTGTTAGTTAGTATGTTDATPTGTTADAGTGSVAGTAASTTSGSGTTETTVAASGATATQTVAETVADGAAASVTATTSNLITETIEALSGGAAA